MDILLKAIPIAIPVILVILIFLMGYVKAPPDVAYIISGLRKHPKVLIGKAGIKIPFLERVDKLIVRQISIDIKSEGYIPTQDFIGVDVDAVAKVRVMTDPEGIQLAMKNFLNMTEDDFNRAIVDSLQGNMREIIGTITLKEICNDRKKFGDEVQSKAQTDMNALGIQIISCNIQRVTDENSLINSLGQDNMSKIQKDAAIAKEQEAAGIAAVGQAEAEAIRAKALAEAEGIDKKAEAMKKYGEAAVIEMIMNALPEIAKNVAEPLSKVDKITMYGEGNSAKLLSDIVNGTTQVTEGISAGMGLDLKSLLAGALGGKLAAGSPQPVQVTVAPQAQPDAAAASADTPEQQV